MLTVGWRVQVQSRAAAAPYRDLDEAGLLALKADRKPWLVVLPLERFRDLLGRRGLPDGVPCVGML